MGSKPLRILHSLGGLGPGGIESFLMSVYRQIDRKRIQFDFMVPEQLEYHYSREVRELGGNIYPVPYGKKDYFASNNRLRIFYQEMGYKIVHLHVGHLHSMQALEQAEAAGVPVRILHAHCSKGEICTTRDAFDAFVHACNRSRIWSATDFFACSRLAAEYFGFERGPRRADWKTILNGIDISRFTFDSDVRLAKRAELGVESNDVLIGNVGRNENQKNQALLIKALPIIEKSIPNVKLLIVGDGSLHDDLLDLAGALSVLDRCIFLSNRRDVAELCSAMDVFAFPSIFEGLGIALVEAESNGLPCVISENVPQEAVITSNCTICGVDSGGAPEDWANQIVRAVDRGRLDGASAQVEDAGFSIEKTARQLEEFYLTSIERH